jgi:bifunctional non-homologous end joining protein LigD
LCSTPAFRRAGPKFPIGRNGSTRLNTTVIVQREGKRVRLFTRNGYDWSHRFPLIVEAALRNRQSSFVIDGEAVLLGFDGRSDFNGLHSRQHDKEVQFYAFDMLVA